MPAVVKVREAANRAKCFNNLKQIVLAMHNHNDAMNVLPPLAGSFPKKDDPSVGTLFFYLLPYVEQDNLYKNAFDESDPNSKGYKVWVHDTYGKAVSVFICPEDKSNPNGELFHGWLATSSYAGNALVFGKGTPQGDPISLEGAATIPASFPDGTSNTMVIAERYQKCGADANAWGYYGDYYWVPAFAYYGAGKFQTTPTQQACDPALAQTSHSRGMNVGLGDGSARMLSSKISGQTYWHACTPAGGEVLGADW